MGFGKGFCQDKLSRRIDVIMGRYMYITDKESGAWHTAVGLPMTENFDFYECRHGHGYSVITCEKNGVCSEITIFVPNKGDFEQWIVKIKVDYYC